MILFFVLTAAMDDLRPQDLPDGARVGVVPIGGDFVRAVPDHVLRLSEEPLGRVHVAVDAEHRIDQVPVGIDRAVQVGPN